VCRGDVFLCVLVDTFFGDCGDHFGGLDRRALKIETRVPATTTSIDLAVTHDGIYFVFRVVSSHLDTTGTWLQAQSFPAHGTFTAAHHGGGAFGTN
jgi:hypothetical protein